LHLKQLSFSDKETHITGAIVFDNFLLEAKNTALLQL